MMRTDPALLEALARALRYQRLLDKGCYASISEMPADKRIEQGYLGRCCDWAGLSHERLLRMAFNTFRSGTPGRRRRPSPTPGGPRGEASCARLGEADCSLVRRPTFL